MEQLFLAMGRMSQKTGALGNAKCHYTVQQQQRVIASINERQRGDGNPGAALLRQPLYTWGSLFLAPYLALGQEFGAVILKKIE